MDFRVLGPLSVEDERGQLPLDGPRVRALLAFLLLHANTPVSTSDLLDELWGEDLPKSGATAVQNAVARLRKSLGDRVTTAGAAYFVRVEPGELDLHRFRGLVEEAAAGSAEQRATLLREALELWRGEALGSVGAAAFVTRERARLDGERLAVLNDRIDADLALSRHAALVPELAALVAEHPLDERFRGQLILALYRSGRQAAALDVYRETRQVLADELGLEPSPALRELERAVLRQDPELDAPRPPARADADAPRRRRRVVVAAGLAALFAAGAATAIIVGRGRDSEAQSARSTTAPAHTAPAIERGTSSVTATRPRHGHIVVRPIPATTAATTNVAATSTSASVTPVTTEPRTTTAAARRKQGHPKIAIAKTTKATTRRTSTTTRTTTTTATTVGEPSGPPLVTDTFDGPADTSFWHTYTLGEGPELTQRDGRVEVFIPANATPYGQYRQIAGTYEARCAFPADFDVQVDYELLQWPAGNGISVKLTASMHDRKDFPRDIYPQVFRRSLPGQEHYHSYVVANDVAVNTEDRRGRLRIARRNNVLVTYYWKRERWVKMDSAILPGIAQIDFAAMTGGDEWQQRDVTVAFDNFVLFASRADCS